MPAKNLSLVEQAKAARVIRKKTIEFSSDELDLAMAWVNDEINLTQVAAALKRPPGNTYTFLAFALKQILQK